MKSATALPKEYRFGRFQLDLDLRRLTKDGQPVATGGLPLRMLAVLIAADGKVVSREELKAGLWPHAARIDTGRRLNTAMRALREALGEAADAPVFIETVPGRGYRWIGGAPAPPPRGRSFIVSALTAMVAVAGLILWNLPLGAERLAPTPFQRERLVEIAGRTARAPDEAGAQLDALLAERPSYATAQVLRAELAMSQWRSQPTPARLEIARRKVADARAQAGATPDVLTLSAELLLTADWDWRAAEADYRHALSREPAHVGARRGLAWLLLNSGREGEALAFIEPMLAHVAADGSTRAELGWLLLRMRRPDLALALCEGAETQNLLSCRHTAFARLGRTAEARRAGLALMREVGAQRAEIADVARGSAEAGYARFLEWRARAFLREGATWFERAQVLADAGENEQALASLERAAAAREPRMFKLPTTEEFAALRTTPRYIALLNRIGLEARR